MNRSSRSPLDFQDHRHDQRAAGGTLHNEALEVLADLFLDDAVVGFFFVAGGFQGLQHDLARLRQEAVLARGKAAHHNFRGRLHPARELVDGNDGQHDAVFTEVTTIANHQVFHHVGARAGVDANAPHGHTAGLAGAGLIEFQNIPAFEGDHLAHRALHGGGQFPVAAQLAEFAVDRNEIARLHQVDNQLELLLAGVAADVYRGVRTVLVDDVGVTAEEVVDHAVNSFLVARNDAGRKHHRVADFDLGVLVVVHRGAGERRHGLALGAADQHANLARGEILDFAGVDEQPVGHIDVAKVGSDGRRIGHGAAHQRDFAVVLVGQFEGQLDAMNG